MKNYFLLAISLCFIQFSFAQFTVTKHDLSSFHSDPSTHSVAQAADGTMYVVMVDYFYSGDGKVFVKNDGSGWATMTPPCDDCILDVVADNDGVIWAGTNQGIYKLDTDGQWTLVIQEGEMSTLHFTSSGLLYAVHNPDGLVSWDGTTLINHNGTGTPVTTYVNLIVSDSNDKIWMRPASGMFSFDGTDFEFFNDFVLPNGLGIDQNDQMWFSDAGEIYYEENGSGVEASFSSEFSTLAPHAGFTIDRDGIFWIGQLTITGALYRYNPATSNIQSLTWSEIDANIDQNWKPAKFFEDRDGDMWVASGSSGVFYEIRDSEGPPSGLTPGLKSTVQVQVAPNPVKNQQLTLNLNLAEATILKGNIVNTLGQVVHTFPAQKWVIGKQNATIDLPVLAAGVYQLSLESEDGGVVVEMFVVE